MQFTSPSLNARNQQAAAFRPTFNVVSIHDGFVPGIRAQEAISWLEHTLIDALQVRSASWSFRDLERAELRATSIREGAAADVIIIAAADGRQKIPEQVKRWLESCLQRQRRGRAVLVDLHDEEVTPGDSENVCSFLGGLARRWHTELMCNEALDQRLNRTFATRHVERRWQAAQTLHAHPEIDGSSDVLRWGLNE